MYPYSAERLDFVIKQNQQVIKLLEKIEELLRKENEKEKENDGKQ